MTKVTEYFRKNSKPINFILLISRDFFQILEQSMENLMGTQVL
jgi:hypothetical protein